MELPVLPEHGGTDGGVEPLAGAPLVLGERERASIARDLANAIEGEVRFDPHNRMLYATDASLYQVEPIGVVIPASVEDACRAAQFCIARGLPILPRGGGTSLAGQCTNRAVVIDCSVNCRAILGLDAISRRVRVEPGITIDDLNDQIAGSGLFFAPDPATSRHANIGGAIGNNAAGARSILYGRTAENLRGVEVMLGDGSVARLEEGASRRDPRVAELTRRVLEIVLPLAPLIRERFPRTIRRNAGYALDMIARQALGGAAWDGRSPDEAMLARVNLAHLICGSEGTLGLVLGAELELRQRPRAKGLVVLGFDSLDAAIDAVLPILETKPSAVELLDDMVIDLARANAEHSRYVDLMPAPASGPLKAVLYVEYFADSPAELEGGFAALRRVVAGMGGVGAREYIDAGAMLSAWKLRKAGEPLLHGIPGQRKPITFVEDNAVPVENLAAFVREFRAIVARHGTRAAFWAHASVGVLHVRPLLDIHAEEDRRHMREIAVEVADLAKRLGGVMSGEHGDGRARGPLLERYFGPEIMRAFREVKLLFDPRNLFNPGDIVPWAGEPRPIESIARKLRVEPSEGRPVRAPDGPTYFTYEDAHGFGAAVEMCNGAGVCRKKQGGTMCPSYMATLDERHSTRGRANALRLAITGQLEGAGQGAGASRWNDPGTIETLDLCLSCKACKGECPSNVDVARLKAEYTAQRYREAGVPLAARMMGNIRALNRVGSAMPWLANAMARFGPLRALADRMLGLDPRRSLPAFAPSLARSWPRDRVPSPDHARPTVVLFGDCFTMYNEPGIGLATRRVLAAFGYRVVLADAGCCARALISQGMLERAIETIDATAQKLWELVERERAAAIVVAEPSCLSAIKDDWLGLRANVSKDKRRRLAELSFLPEQFLEARWDAHPRRPTFRALGPGERLVLHAHCHQKALWGEGTSAAPLRRMLGDALDVLDSGCCGMAGAFGYGRQRYDLSMQIGERVLLPAARAADPGSTVVATGTSCRHQIHDGAGRAALHPIEVLAARLIEDARYADA